MDEEISVKLINGEPVLIVEVNGGMVLVLTLDELQIIEDEKRHGHKAVRHIETARKPPTVQQSKC